eukprot:1246491-Pleurochrysis_carterae.AAC.1
MLTGYRRTGLVLKIRGRHSGSCALNAVPDLCRLYSGVRVSGALGMGAVGTRPHRRPRGDGGALRLGCAETMPPLHPMGD